MTEIWRDVKGYEGLYQVSNIGRVRTLAHITNGKPQRAMIRKAVRNAKTGYLYVSLSKNGIAKNVTVHRLVAIAFVDNPEGKQTVNHKNENKCDNRAENLEWMTLPENLRYGTHDERARLNRPDMSGDKHFNYGKFGSEATTHKGRVIGVNIHDGSVVEFDTAATASRVLGLSSGQLCDHLKGRYKSCGGYRWRRINE